MPETVHLGMTDRVEITELISRYAHAIDGGDVSAAVECFTADALVEYDGGQIRLERQDELTRFYTRTLTSPSTHLISNTLIEVSGNSARTLSSAIACITRRAGFVTVRGLTYEMRCVRRDEGWRIANLLHRSTWEYAVPGGPIALPQPSGN